MYRLIMVGVAAAAVALLALGCGSSNSDEATAAQVSKAQFLKQAEKLCDRTQEDMQKAILRGSSDAANISTMASLLTSEAEELDDLSGPEEIEVKIETLTATISEVVGILEREGENGFENPRIAAYKSEAKNLGLEEC